MFDFLKAIFKKPLKLQHIGRIALYVDAIVELVDKENLLEPGLRNCAIDVVIKLLEEQKEPEEEIIKL